MNAFPSSQPINRDSIGVKQSFGMSLRDYFAAKAMQGMLSKNTNGELVNELLAKFSYEIADAMLEARDERD